MVERLRSPEFSVELACQYASTFIPRRDLYPLQLENGRYTQIKKPLQPDLIVQHLTNHHRNLPSVTLGAYALDANSRANWVCLDADDDEEWYGLWRMAHVLRSEGIPSYPECSRRGGHLWLFTPPLDGKDAKAFGRQLTKAFDVETVEVYPKQDRLQKGAGSFVRLPLGVHRKSGRVYYFLDLDGKPLFPTLSQQIAALVDPERVPMDYIEHILSSIPEPEPQAPHVNQLFERGSPAHNDLLSEQIKNTATVHEFVSRYVELDPQLRGHCPFHDDQHKSFQVNADENYWNCYAHCGGGSIIDFAMKLRERAGEDASFKATIRALSEMLL